MTKEEKHFLKLIVKLIRKKKKPKKEKTEGPKSRTKNAKLDCE